MTETPLADNMDLLEDFHRSEYGFVCFLSQNHNSKYIDVANVI